MINDKIQHVLERQPDITECPACGDRFVVAAVAPPGERERPVYLRCATCGRERADLEFYEA